MKMLTWVCLAFGFVVASAQAEPVEYKPSPDPYATMAKVIDATFARLNQERSKGEIPPATIEQIIEQEMMPYVDYKYAAYKVIGRYIKSTDADQRQRFISAFYYYLISTYAQALGQYDNQQVKIDPPESLSDKSIISIGASIIDGNRPEIKLAFKFRKQKSSDDWYAFDMIAEGISLLSAKQSEIGPLIGKQGIDDVITLLEEKHLEKVASNG
jgi:phospholipid transport system substrate-binding protein